MPKRNTNGPGGGRKASNSAKPFKKTGKKTSGPGAKRTGKSFSAPKRGGSSDEKSGKGFFERRSSSSTRGAGKPNSEDKPFRRNTRDEGDARPARRTGTSRFSDKEDKPFKRPSGRSGPGRFSDNEDKKPFKRAASRSNDSDEKPFKRSAGRSGPGRFGDNDEKKPFKRATRFGDSDEKKPFKRAASRSNDGDDKPFKLPAGRSGAGRFSDNEDKPKRAAGRTGASRFGDSDEKPKRAGSSRFGDSNEKPFKRAGARSGVGRFSDNDEKPSRRKGSDSEDDNDEKPIMRVSRGGESGKGYAAKDSFKAGGRPRRKGKDDAEPAGDGKIRLNRFIANSGICSRREADELITMGLISVNGKVITELGFKVNPTDEVRHESKVLRAEKPVYVLMNKPKGFLTTTSDPQERNTVMHIIGNSVKERIYPVGRLDRNTTGLLLLTNDGDLADKLMHPSYKAKKIYKVELDRPLTKADFEKIAEGVELEEGRAHVDDVAIVSEDKKTVGVELHIGWNRVVRRIFETLGYEVIKLDRAVYAGLDKKDLARGQWRFLKQEEIIRLKHLNS